MPNDQTLSGYYRYTDIWFEWPNALKRDGKQEECDAVKSFFAHDNLLHPDNPLHPNVPEIEMYMGILQNNESRLLFTSRQVDYARYWLHNMGRTKEPIPLPWSNCLLLREDLKVISPITYKDGKTLKDAVKKIDKNNKRLMKGGSDNLDLEARRIAFEKARTLWSAKQGVFLAIDFEAWEYEHTLITELGVSAVHWDNEGKEIYEDSHWMLGPGLYQNGKYVKDNRLGYSFGESVTVRRNDFAGIISNVLNKYEQYGTVFLVFHDHSQDIKYLRQLDAPIKQLEVILPDTTPATGLYVLDTSELFAGLEGDGHNKRSLETVCHLLGIPTRGLHNAGNDAHYTLQALKAMASGAQLDEQREERWPNHTHTRAGVRVEFTEEEEEIYSDDDWYYDEPNLPPIKAGNAEEDVNMEVDEAKAV
ncbi:hypothetical protein CYLTODRAFT_364306 [Cylindrobasidium torrendii FP15055 ss-10]|uniref:Gfd2/YDR514C-like C-terminal domain-containing protein n=1 Tax=Cylindrobasidium torrendii FP15055 ss-10 TaxID=1314674 RepID=A0A0D7BUV4_9AGAR|nr:hypothetical protein CYLTODRAFT_364306 [Cylindrobasidium torrendii FP15055 ss-10]